MAKIQINPFATIVSHQVPAMERGKASFVVCPACGECYQIGFDEMYRHMIEYFTRIGIREEIPKPARTLKYRFYFTVYDGGRCCGRGPLVLDMHEIPKSVTQLK